MFIYPWSVKYGYMAAISDVGAGAGPLVKTYQVTLEFDEQGLLTRYERQKYGFFCEGGPGAKGERFSADDLKIPDGKTGIFVYRSSSLVAINSYVPIRVDEEHLADLQYGGFAIAVTDPGDHAVGYPSRAFWGWEWKTLNLTTKSNERVFIKVKIGFKLDWMDATKVELEVVPEVRALNAIKKMRRSVIVRPSHLFPSEYQ